MPLVHYPFLCNILLNFILLTSCQAIKRSNYAAEPILRTCGISINSDFMQVDGRVLAAPKVLTYPTRTPNP